MTGTGKHSGHTGRTRGAEPAIRHPYRNKRAIDTRSHANLEIRIAWQKMRH